MPPLLLPVFSRLMPIVSIPLRSLLSDKLQHSVAELHHIASPNLFAQLSLSLSLSSVTQHTSHTAHKQANELDPRASWLLRLGATDPSRMNLESNPPLLITYRRNATHRRATQNNIGG